MRMDIAVEAVRIRPSSASWCVLCARPTRSRHPTTRGCRQGGSRDSSTTGKCSSSGAVTRASSPSSCTRATPWAATTWASPPQRGRSTTSQSTACPYSARSATSASNRNATCKHTCSGSIRAVHHGGGGKSRYRKSRSSARCFKSFICFWQPGSGHHHLAPALVFLVLSSSCTGPSG